MVRLLAAFVLALAACGAPDARLESESRQAIIGGSDDSSDPTVGALWILGANGVDNFCTGISIGPQTFATSAHCFENAEGGTIFVVFTPNAFQAFDGGHRVDVDDFKSTLATTATPTTRSPKSATSRSRIERAERGPVRRAQSLSARIGSGSGASRCGS